MKIQLAKSSVVFNQKNHTYFLGDKQLKGITGVLHRRLFKDKYDGVSEEVLKKAAERGTMVHEQCELADTLGIEPSLIEALNYLAIKTNNGFTTIANEYLVSDEKNYASSIDVVFKDLSIADIKTTYTLDEEYVSWQLSIYAYLFELQNPTLKVNKLYAIWLRGKKAQLVEVPRKTIDLVISLLECDKQDKDFINPVPSYICDKQDKLIQLSEQIAELSEEKETIIASIKETMIRDKVKSIDTGACLFTIKDEQKRMSFDSKRFKADNPALFAQYEKETTIAPSLTFKIR